MKKPTRERAAAIADNLINGNTRDAVAGFDGYTGRGAAALALMVAMNLRPDELDGTLVEDMLTQILIRLPFTGFDK